MGTGGEFIGNDEVRCLVEAGDFLHPSCFAKTDLCVSQYVFDGNFNNLADEFTHGVAVRSERPAEETLIEKDGVRCPEVGDGPEAFSAFCGIGFFKAMQDARSGWTSQSHWELTPPLCGRVLCPFRPTWMR